MDLFIENPGFSHIGEKIFKCLDFNTKSTCRLVKKSWKIMLEKNSYTFNSFIEMIKNSGRIRNRQTLVKYLAFHRPDDQMWLRLLRHVHFKLESKWIDMYLQEVILDEMEKSNFAKRLLSPPFEIFTRAKNAKMIELILQEILYNVGQFQFNKEYNLPLYLAVVNNFTETVKIIAENLTEQQILNTKCGGRLKGTNIFHIAAEDGQLEILKFLSTKVSNPIVSNAYGDTPIHLAARYGHLEVVNFLVSYTSEPNVANNCGETPASLAKSHGHDEIVQFLERMSQKRKSKE